MGFFTPGLKIKLVLGEIQPTALQPEGGQCRGVGRVGANRIDTLD